jgi:polar amino acid transport system permease protein
MWRRVAEYLLAAMLLAGIVFGALLSIGYRWNWADVWEYRVKFVQGWVATVLISVASLALSLVIGVVLALVRRARVPVLGAVGTVIVEVIRGTPLLVQILIFYYGIFHAVRLENAWLGGVLILSLFAGAYVSEIVRAGIESVGATQWESARALGLTTAQIYRHVVLPQAARACLPPLTGQFVSLIKDSSLLKVISVGEFTMQADEVHSLTYGSFESYLPLAAGYLLLTLPLSLVSRWMEGRLRYEA